jgi:hypothetical protein
MVHELPDIPRSKLKGAAVKMYNAYARLTTQDRTKVDELLLAHAFMPRGTNAYLSERDCSSILRCFRFGQLATVSPEIAEAWLAWALEISTTRPSRRACRKAILKFLSAVFG